MNRYYRWRDRAGAVTELTISERPRDEADEVALFCGWPGHAGGRLNYLVDDAQKLWHRVDRWRASWPDGVVGVSTMPHRFGPSLAALLAGWQLRLHRMTAQEQREMWNAQRQSWVRSFRRGPDDRHAVAR